VDGNEAVYWLVLDGTNIVFQLWCWWTNKQRREKKGSGASIDDLIKAGRISVTVAMDAFIDEMLRVGWEDDDGDEDCPDIKIFFDKPRGKLHHQVCKNKSETKFLAVEMSSYVDPEIVNLVANSWLTHKPSDTICIITNDQDLTRDIYEAVGLNSKLGHKSPIIMVKKVDATIGGCRIIPSHINVRDSHSLMQAKSKRLLHLANPYYRNGNHRRNHGRHRRHRKS